MLVMSEREMTVLNLMKIDEWNVDSLDEIRELECTTNYVAAQITLSRCPLGLISVSVTTLHLNLHQYTNTVKLTIFLVRKIDN